MYNQISVPPEVIEVLAKESPCKQNSSLAESDSEYFKGFIKHELYYITRAINLDEDNKLMLSLHINGLMDEEIAQAMKFYILPLKRRKMYKNFTANAVECRRRRIIKKIGEKEWSKFLGIVTLIYEKFGYRM